MCCVEHAPRIPILSAPLCCSWSETTGLGIAVVFFGFFFYCAPLLFASTSPNSTPCRYAPMYLPGHRWVRLRVEFFAPVPSTPCGLYRQFPEFDCMQVCSEHYGRFFLFSRAFCCCWSCLLPPGAEFHLFPGGYGSWLQMQATNSEWNKDVGVASSPLQPEDDVEIVELRDTDECIQFYWK